MLMIDLKQEKTVKREQKMYKGTKEKKSKTYWKYGAGAGVLGGMVASKHLEARHRAKYLAKDSLKEIPTRPSKMELMLRASGHKKIRVRTPVYGLALGALIGSQIKKRNKSK